MAQPEGDDVGAVKTILGLGEEKMGEVVNQLLANEAFVSAVQKAITGGLSAKRAVDKNLSRVLSIANVPTLDDVDQVKTKLRELEDALQEIGERVRALSEKAEKAEKADAPKKKK
jgi:hypothetical protein